MKPERDADAAKNDKVEHPTPIHRWTFADPSESPVVDTVGGARPTVDRIASAPGRQKNALRFGGAEGAKIAKLGRSATAMVARRVDQA